MRAGLALQVVSGGVTWLVDRQLRAARQLNRGEQPPALVTGWVGDGDAPGGQVRQCLFDVVTHQVELVLARPVSGVDGDLGWRQLEDQPATAGIDPCKSEHVTDEDSISLRVSAVENDVCSVDHVSLSFPGCYLTTRNHRSVLVGDSNTLVLSSSICSLTRGSKKRRPSPKRTGTMPIWISSTSPARRHC